MILTATSSPQRFQRVFKKLTLLQIQVKSAGSVSLSHDQGECSNSITNNDGATYTQASTNPPVERWWSGELWFATASGAPQQFAIIVVGEA